MSCKSNLRLRKLGKEKEILASVKSPFQKLIFGNNGQNLRKNRNQNFLFLSNFPWFWCYFWHNILSTRFILNRQFWLFDPKCPKKIFLAQNRKSEHHHQIQHIWINLYAKFWLFGGKICPNRVENTLFVINNTCFPKVFTYYETHFLSLKIIFENSRKVRATHFNISVGTNAVEIRNLCKVVLLRFFFRNKVDKEN